jgi:excinuclease ABC subunit C
MLASLKKFLNLDVFPTKIECYDISTFHGSQTVASQVCFKNGIPSKSSYRKYIIKETCGHADDFASLREVISRRFRSHQNLQNLPDLLILDGGTPQVREIAKTLNELGLKNLSFIGLAKARVQSNFHASKIKEIPERVLIPKRNSELFCNEDPETKILTQGSPEFKILTQIRDEAHRFAISFHRKKRAKESLQSLFSNIKGLGAKEKQKLKEAYPKNLYAFLNESQEVVCEKTGIPRKIIDELYSAMKKK